MNEDKMKGQTKQGQGHTPDGREIPNHADCGCEIKWLGDIGYLDKCPMHTAAPELLQMLKRFIDPMGNDVPSDKEVQELIDRAEARRT